MTPLLFGIVGWKNSGKTTLMVKLVAAFTARGLKVAAVKHAHHAFDIDHGGRDSYRFREAGARMVAVSSPKRFAVMTELHDEPEPALQELIRHIEGVDIILIEGFKRESHPKLEVRRKAALNQTPVAPSDPSILAVAADFEIEHSALPFFDLDDVEAIAKFVLNNAATPDHCLKTRSRT